MAADYTGHRLLELDSSGKIVHEMKVPDWNVASIGLIP